MDELFVIILYKPAAIPTKAKKAIILSIEISEKSIIIIITIQKTIAIQFDEKNGMFSTIHPYNKLRKFNRGLMYVQPSTKVKYLWYLTLIGT